jgi:methylated-DNA-[protein]-cysteine S-methyltransferase
MTSMKLQGWTIDTPVAPWSVVTDGDVVVASGFCDLDVLLARLEASVDVVQPTGHAADAVRGYLAGQHDSIADVNVRQPGGEFFQEIWRAMRGIEAGSTWSYRELATKAGRPDAVRAAGTACARNLVAPFVPCHRVVRADGSLGGYAYGLDVKRWLLAQESIS